MGLVAATTVGLIIWIVLWAFEVKAIDSFMITIVIVFLAVGARMLAPVFNSTRT